MCGSGLLLGAGASRSPQPAGPTGQHGHRPQASGLRKRLEPPGDAERRGAACSCPSINNCILVNHVLWGAEPLPGLRGAQCGVGSVGCGVRGAGCGVSAAPRGSAAASSSSPGRCLHPSRSLVTAVGDSWQAPPETCIWEIPIGAEGKGGAAIRREQFILLFNSRLATPALSGGSRSKRLSQRCLSPRPRYGKGLGMSGPGLKAHHPNQTPGFSGPRDESCP